MVGSARSTSKSLCFKSFALPDLRTIGHDRTTASLRRISLAASRQAYI